MFTVDQLGGHSIVLKRRGDFENLHNSGREKEYNITLPRLSAGTDLEEQALDEGYAKEVGIWFETDWSQQHIIVKKIKKDSWAGKMDIKGFICNFIPKQLNIIYFFKCEFILKVCVRICILPPIRSVLNSPARTTSSTTPFLVVGDVLLEMNSVNLAHRYMVHQDGVSIL